MLRIVGGVVVVVVIAGRRVVGRGPTVWAIGRVLVAPAGYGGLQQVGLVTYKRWRRVSRQRCVEKLCGGRI